MAVRSCSCCRRSACGFGRISDTHCASGCTWGRRSASRLVRGLRIVPCRGEMGIRHRQARCGPWCQSRACRIRNKGKRGEPSGEFVYHMEDVLEVYTRPYDPSRPQVCLDETSVQLIGEKRIPVAMAPGRLARFDYEYERALFMLNEPLRGWREVVVADRRTAIDFAHVVKHLVDVHYPHADKIVLVMDNYDYDY